jgi:hypothetical protein
MAPPPSLRARQSLSKERFPTYFGALKTQNYHDPATSRGAHGYVGLSYSCFYYIHLLKSLVSLICGYKLSSERWIIPISKPLLFYHMYQ